MASRRRRSSGEGSTRHRKDGRWEIAIPVGRTARGNTKRIFVYGRTLNEAQRKADQRKAEAYYTEWVLPTAITITAFVDRWLESKKGECSPTTIENYRWHMQRYVLPVLGSRQLQKVTPLQLNDLLARLSENTAYWLRPPEPEPRPDGQPAKPPRQPQTSPRTARYVRTLLHGLFETAVGLEVIRRNPVPKPPKGSRRRARRKQVTIWSVDEVRAFLAAARGSRFWAAYLLALANGPRRGELLGLRLSDLAPGTRTLRIQRVVVSHKGKPLEKDPKTVESRRMLYLSPFVAAALEERRVVVEEERRLATEAGVWEGGADPYLFGTALGRPTDPRNFVRAFHRIIEGVDGLRRIRFHDLRHTHASLSLTLRDSLAAISARLGHYSPAFTLEVYSHLVPGQEREPVDVVGEALLGPGERAN